MLAITERRGHHNIARARDCVFARGFPCSEAIPLPVAEWR
jgi:hypothetical protein